MIRITPSLQLKIEFRVHPFVDVGLFGAPYSFFEHSPAVLSGVFFMLCEAAPNSERTGEVCVRGFAGHQRMKDQMQRHGSSHFADCSAACCHAPAHSPSKLWSQDRIALPNRTAGSASRPLSLSAKDGVEQAWKHFRRRRNPKLTALIDCGISSRDLCS